VTLADRFFVILMFIMTGTVAWVGTLAYREGQRTEMAKANGEVLLSWLEAAGSRRHSGAFEPSACAGSPGESEVSGAPATRLASEARWDKCWSQLLATGGPLADLSDPFTGGLVKLVAQCDHRRRDIAGGIVLQKLVDTPPGSAMPQVAVPLGAADSIAGEMKLRVTICDKGGYPIIIGDAGF
jgi:hypothetical protein